MRRERWWHARSRSSPQPFPQPVGSRPTALTDRIERPCPTPPRPKVSNGWGTMHRPVRLVSLGSPGQFSSALNPTASQPGLHGEVARAADTARVLLGWRGSPWVLGVSNWFVVQSPDNPPQRRTASALAAPPNRYTAREPESSRSRCWRSRASRDGASPACQDGGEQDADRDEVHGGPHAGTRCLHVDQLDETGACTPGVD